ncbi:MAG: alpha/beta hydrolase [Ruminococcaceae bacterium]|nr:alpha/beta hydrolase [Oscillospiraceae bacterium]
MRITVNAFNLESSDGIHTLKGKIYIPDGEIKGLFQIVHGMTEHIDRYHEFMSLIAKSGYICFGFNNLGHKGTAEDNELGFIAEKDGYKYLIDDVVKAYSFIKEKYNYDNYVLMGHSMGSFIVRCVAAEYPELIDKLIICGTGSNCLSALFGVGIALAIEKIKGNRYCSKILDKIIFGAYNLGFEPLSKYEWLTKDRSIIEKYQKDKYCTFRFSVSAIKDLLILSFLANRNKWYKSIPKQLPILLISGDRDPVGANGRGVRSIYKKLRMEELNDVNMFLYKDCRHEILNDTCKNEVVSDIMEFIN